LIVDRPNDIMRVGNTSLFEIGRCMLIVNVLFLRNIARDFDTVSTRVRVHNAV
ncbi:hypothetical protein BKA82DRAFT_3966814, partial [Pisolithus tinctorius]